MKKLSLTSLLLIFCFQVTIMAQNKAVMGFSDEAAKKQLQLEADFDKLPKTQNLDDWMKFLSSRPHHVGSEFDKEVVDFVAEKFKSWGYDVKVEKFNVLFPTPKLRLLEMTSPEKYTAELTEPPVEGDESSTQLEEALPGYNAFSVDGDVTAELVFVNYGIPADYEELERRGIDVKGKIVIAKYQGSWRGIKPKVAAEKGAIGCIMYSDPGDDGYGGGDVYPTGPYKNEYGVQRGAVMDLPYQPGDPLTPGYGATDDAKRLKIEDATSLTKIPVLPISYHDALPLLKAIGGPVAPGSWRGGMPITYHIGPGPAKVHLKLEFNWDMKPAYDVIATLKGSTYPDEWVLRGNHHDAWVHGANDPISGLVALMEEARVVSELVKKGFKPKRTIKYCAWGAEEPGLIGSTEWVETNEKELKEKAVAYINTDGTGAGFLGVGGSHTLEEFFDQITREVKDPVNDVSVFERRNAVEKFQGKPAWNYYNLSALGSGSDYSPFFQHLGISSFNMGFGGESSGGEYHTMYDSYKLYTRFKDPGFVYGATLVKVAGRTTLRLANAEVLPFEFEHFANTVSEYVEELKKMADKMRKDTELANKLVSENLYALVDDPSENLIAPKQKKIVPYFNFAPIENSLADLKRAADAFDKASKNVKPNEVKDVKKLNSVLKDMEKSLLREKGLPKRPWYKHHIYAPGFYTGYGVKTLPGVREAIEQREFENVDEQVNILATVLKDFTAKIKEATALLK
ncbi:N-acetylated-alpha-linked acidic dipeptidase [Flavobacteriaceae bacterium MAR_2010_188]|nr:N-acetylated-alpha-linked acidic dipeptidase [Flavobacteriaceae bacterium MAR_2010_188]